MSSHWDHAEGLTLPAVEQPRRPRPRWWRPVVKLFGLLVAMVLAGALVAGLTLPWLGGAAAAARYGSNLLAPAEASIVDQPPLSNTRILARNGEPITELYARNRTVLPSELIPQTVKDALVAIEDARFYQHNGLDAEGLARAMVRNVVAGSVVEGGSTLTQQLVKQVRLQTADSPEERAAAVDESIGRKLVEAQLAMGLEQRLSKDEILTRYLNRVYFGAGAYGIHAAATTYFGVRPRDLTLAQAATLAGLVQSPSRYDPFVAPERATARRDLVISRMESLGFIDPVTADEARAEPMELRPDRSVRGCGEAHMGAFFCDYAVDYLTGTLGLDLEELERGGYTIRTTLDPAWQAAADAAVAANIAYGDPRAAIYTQVQPGTGEVMAMAVNRIYGLDPEDPAQTTVPLHTAAGQGTGSTYKVFTAAAALERGYGLQYQLRTESPYESTVFEDGDEPYDVENAGENFPEKLTLEQALYLSSNTYFLALQDKLGSVEAPVRMAQRLGLTSLDPIADRVVAENRGSFSFGAEATSPLALTSAYSTLAARGTRCAPTPILEVIDPSGKPATAEDGSPLLPQDRCTDRVVDPALADALNQALRKDVEPGYPGQTGERAYVPGYTIAGKTGTSQDRYSATFVGYTPEVAASVMVYDPVENRNVGTFGGGLPAEIWFDAMKNQIRTLPPTMFGPAVPKYVQGTIPSPPDDPREDRDPRRADPRG